MHLDFLNALDKRYRTEPIIINWVLRRLKNLRRIDDEAADQLEEAYFDEKIMRTIIEWFDDFDIASPLKHLSFHRFAPVIGMMVEKWPRWKGRAMERGAEIIALNAPDIAAGMFKAHCDWNTEILSNSDKISSVLQSLPHLAPDNSRAVFNELFPFFLEHVSQISIEKEIFCRIIATVWDRKHPERERIIENYLVFGAHLKKSEYRDRLSEFLWALEAPEFEFGIIDEILLNGESPVLGDLTPFYRPADAAERLFDLAADIRRRRYDSVIAFINTEVKSVKDNGLAELLIRLMNNKTFIASLHKKKQRPVFHALVLAVCFSVLRRESLDLSGMTLEQVVDCLCLDVPQLPDERYLDQMIDYFRSREKTAVAEQLVTALEENCFWECSHRIVEVMSRLGYSQFIGPMLDLAGNDEIPDYLHAALYDALAGYGEDAVHYILKHADPPDAHNHADILMILGETANPAAVSYLENNFDRFYEFDRELLLSACEALYTGPWIEKIRNKAGKGQDDIDHAFLILSLLRGRSGPEIDAMLEAVRKKSIEQREAIEAFLSGDLCHGDHSYLRIELQCRLCGDTNFYNVEKVYVNPEAAGKPYIAHELTCINCNRPGEFDFTSRGLMCINSEMMRWGLIDDRESRRDVMAESPLKLIPMSIMGRLMDVGEGVNRYRKQLEANPDDPELHIGLANIYRNTGQVDKAKPLYIRAMEIDPTYVECYYYLAHFEMEAGRKEQARELFEQGGAYLESAKLKETHDGFDMDDMIHAYITAWQALDNPEILSDRPWEADRFEPVRHEPKIGRNDPCPCGSGRKYKKCCLLKE